MHEQSRETLPVALSDLERRKKVHEEILQNIVTSMNDPHGLLAENKRELQAHHDTTLRHIGEIVAHIARRQEFA